MVADFFTKPLQGRLFILHRNRILNIKTPDLRPQECVGTSPGMSQRTSEKTNDDECPTNLGRVPSYAGVVRGDALANKQMEKNQR